VYIYKIESDLKITVTGSYKLKFPLRTALLEAENYLQKEVVWVAVIPMCRRSDWWS